MMSSDTGQQRDASELGGFGDALRGNPLPLFLIGAGVGWLLLARARRTESYDQAADWAERRTRVLRRRARHTFEDARERAGDLFDSARDRVASAAETAAAQVGLRGTGDGAA
jgi:hypothetical protein